MIGRHASEPGDLRARKVLIVDDDDEFARKLQFVVERHGFAARRARNGAVALDAVRLERPDVILLDTVMPVMDGFQFLSALRAMPEAHGIPVIVLSVCSDDAMVSAARHGGATLYLPKPVSWRELITVLRRVTDSEYAVNAKAAQPAAAPV
jgi:DNA-binding response OmpR family regulator